jgi:hypothetical protein
MSAVALLASQEPFTTSRQNLSRLFSTNREHLEGRRIAATAASFRVLQWRPPVQRRSGKGRWQRLRAEPAFSRRVRGLARRPVSLPEGWRAKLEPGRRGCRRRRGARRRADGGVPRPAAVLGVRRQHAVQDDRHTSVFGVSRAQRTTGGGRFAVGERGAHGVQHESLFSLVGDGFRPQTR